MESSRSGWRPLRRDEILTLTLTLTLIGGLSGETRSDRGSCGVLERSSTQRFYIKKMGNLNGDTSGVLTLHVTPGHDVEP